MTERLNVQRLSVAFSRRPVLRALSFGPLQAGTLTALLGSNAAGKSTLLRSLSGEIPSRSAVFCNRQPLEHWPAHHPARPVYVPQDLGMQTSLRVFEAVLLACKQGGGWSVSQVQLDAVSRTLHLLEIAHLAACMLDELSGGQRQLVGIAQAMVRQPQTLLLDEPTSALDLRRQYQVLNLLQRLVREQGLCVVMAIHDINQALRYAGAVLVLHDGQIIAHGPPLHVLTPALLARVYGVQARLEHCTNGHWMVMVEQPLASSLQRTIEKC